MQDLLFYQAPDSVNRNLYRETNLAILTLGIFLLNCQDILDVN